MNSIITFAIIIAAFLFGLLVYIFYDTSYKQNRTAPMTANLEAATRDIRERPSRRRVQNYEEEIRPAETIAERVDQPIASARVNNNGEGTTTTATRIYGGKLQRQRLNRKRSNKKMSNRKRRKY